MFRAIASDDRRRPARGEPMLTFVDILQRRRTGRTAYTPLAMFKIVEILQTREARWTPTCDPRMARRVRCLQLLRYSRNFGLSNAWLEIGGPREELGRPARAPALNSAARRGG